jgi:hypothetical protein
MRTICLPFPTSQRHRGRLIAGAAEMQWNAGLFRAKPRGWLWLQMRSHPDTLWAKKMIPVPFRHDREAGSMSGLNWRGLMFAFLVGAAPTAASAQSVAAIVESVAGVQGKLRAMDYVLQGQVIELGPRGSIVLGYLGSCVRETINGGSVKVGQAQSQITGGRVVRRTVQCDGGRLLLSKKEAEQSGVLVLRKGVDPLAAPQAPKPGHVYSTTPVFILPGGSRGVSISRLDGPPKTITLEAMGGIVDLYESRHELVPGARYEAVASSKSRVFRVDDSAKLNGIGVLGRLIAF